MDNYTKEGCRGFRIQAPICNREVSVDLNTDFSLPDYLPEVKRLLRVRAVVSDPDRYVGVGSADFSGTVDYCILYAGNDGALYTANHAEEYSFSVPVEMTSDFDIGEGVLCDVEVVSEMTVGRVSSPRKLSLRCKLRGDVRLFGTRVVEENVDAEDATAVERLCGEALSARTFTGRGDPLILEDEILFDSQWQDLRVIGADARVLVNEAVAGSDCVTCRGEVYLKLLYCHENGDPTPAVQIRKLPFSQTVPVDGCEVNCECMGQGTCGDVHITVEDGRVVCEVTAKLRVRAQRNDTVRFTRDLYSTVSEHENRYMELALPTALKCMNGNFSLNTTLPLEKAGVRNGMKVMDVSMSFEAATPEREREKYCLVGKCRCHLVLCDGEDLSAQELEVPFRYALDGIVGDVVECDAFVEPVSCRVRPDGERIAIDAELAVAVSVRGEGRLRVLSEAKFGDSVQRASSTYTVCYPAKTETLWSVSKKYHRTVDSVSHMNALPGAAAADSPDSLAGVAYLLV